MKVAITSVFSNLTYNTKNHRGLEAVYFKQLLEENGYEVELIGKKNKNTAEFDFYVDYSTADWQGYDAIFIQLSTANFFGGLVGEHTEPIARALAGYKGKIYALVNDPRIDFLDPVKALKRFNLCQDLEAEWSSIIEDATYLFPGKNIAKFLGRTPKNWQQLDWFTYMFKHRMASKMSSKPSTALFDFDAPAKEWNAIYYGDNRASFREQQIRKYMPNGDKNLLIGYKTNKVNVSFEKKMEHSVLLDTISKSKASLIIGDAEHLDNVITYRFYETMASDCLAAIQIEYDPNMELIQDPVLRDKLYVRSSRDVENLVASYSDDLIARQKTELKNIFDRLDITFKIN
jgi:hypothetical protein